MNSMRAWQAELALEPPDTNPDDETHPDTMRAWAERLAIAVQAELVTAGQAERAWKRAIR